jgi:hypothetical protein
MVSRMPANALRMPLTTNNQNLIRLTRMPANWAASGCNPIATIDRPRGVKCKMMPKMTASTMKNNIDHESCVPGTELAPILVSHDGNCRSPIVGIVREPNSTSASPRNRVSVPIVTAIDGKPNRATSSPLSAPPRAPTTMAAANAGQMPQPWCHKSPTSEPDRPSIEATDRSISPVITTKVTGSAMIAR